MSIIDIDLQRIVFNVVVVSTLLSGLSAASLAESDYVRLEATQCRLGRKTLAGIACLKIEKGDHVKKIAQKNEFVRGLLKMAPVKVELQLRRLQLWQRI